MPTVTIGNNQQGPTITSGTSGTTNQLFTSSYTYSYSYTFPNFNKGYFTLVSEVIEMLAESNIPTDKETLNWFYAAMDEDYAAKAPSFQDAVKSAIIQYKQEKFKTEFNSLITE